MSAGLKPKEGLTFCPRSAVDGSKVDPIFDETGYEASDGEKLASDIYHFRRRDGAADFYSKQLASARAVLEADTPPDDADRRRAVVELETKDGTSKAAVLVLSGELVTEIVGPSVGHVLAFEKWQRVTRQPKGCY